MVECVRELPIVHALAITHKQEANSKFADDVSRIFLKTVVECCRAQPDKSRLVRSGVDSKFKFAVRLRKSPLRRAFVELGVMTNLKNSDCLLGRHLVHR